MLKKQLFFTLFIISNIFYSQNKTSISTVQKHYKNYFELDRESIYLHFNKSEYIYGEEIWFKGYIYDQVKEVPANLTANVYLDIYNSEGVLVKDELFFGLNGFFRGSFIIDNNLTTGTYYVKAYTNWMKNFAEDNSYSTQIHIINETPIKPKKDIIDLSYDIQFLPESGYALIGMNNNLGVKVTDSNGKGVKIEKGIIIRDNEEISTFKTNHLGFGNAIVFYEEGKTYSSKIILKNGDELFQKLPNSKTNGVNFNVKTSLKNNVYLSFNKTISTPDSDFKLLIHKDGFSRSVNIKFKDKQTRDISIDKGNLFEGINIFTLFNSNNQPVAERLIYNHISSSSKSLKLSYRKKNDDSLQFNLTLPRDIENYYNLSISVLPSETIAYEHTDNIISNFKLLPYVKGYIENPKYYFTNVNAETLYSLDLLLLTQGWSRYLWDDIFKNKPQQNYKFEYGLSLIGKITPKTTPVRSLYIGSLRNNRALIKQIDSSRTFTIHNLFPEKNEFVNLTFNLDESRVKDNSNTSFKGSINYTFDDLNNPANRFDFSLLKHNTPRTKILNPLNLNSFIANNLVFINDVFELNEQNKIQRDKPIRRGKSIVISEIDYSKFSLLNVIEDNGFKVSKIGDTVSISAQKTTINPSKKAPSIYVNDILVEPEVLNVIDIELVDEILIDPFGASESNFIANGGEIRIYTQKIAHPEIEQLSKFPFYNIKASNGFTPAKLYYNPKYTFYSTSTYKNYGVIHWYSDFLVSGFKRLKVPDFNQKSLTFYIEGMSDTGALVSDVITVNIPEDK